MWDLRAVAAASCLVFALLAAVPAGAQTPAPPTPGWARFSLFAETARLKDNATGFASSTTDEFANLTIQSASNDNGGLGYAVDVRQANYSGAFQPSQTSIYNVYVDYRSTGGNFGVRLGQMWLNDLGALGSVGGALLEYRPTQTSKLGRFRFGLFSGLEPEPFNAAFVSGVRKSGAYAALDGELGRRSVLGYVTIKNQGMTERQVATMLNFLPVGTKFFVYQAAEYDLKGPAGTGKSGLNYIFANMRYAPSNVIDFQGMYHHGLSLDARSITNDELAGRPVDSRLLDGFLFESVGGRVTVSVTPRFRVWGGYYRDRNNVDATATGRIQAGLWQTNLFGSGLDITVSDNRTDRTANHYDSWYTSLGANLGRSVYVSVDYTTSLSVLSFTDSGGVVVESRPQTKAYSFNSTINLSRVISLILTAQRFKEDTGTDDRVLFGFTLRF